MASDYTPITADVPLTMSRRYYRVTYERADNNIISGQVLLRETFKTNDGKNMSKDEYLISLTDDQVKDVTGFGTYFNRVIDQCNTLKNEWDASGSLATGSIVQLNAV